MPLTIFVGRVKLVHQSVASRCFAFTRPAIPPAGFGVATECASMFISIFTRMLTPNKQTEDA